MPNWPNQVQPLTGPELSQAITSRRLFGIHCWANWNAYDREFASKLQMTVERFSPMVDFFSMDVENPANIHLFEKWGILNVPAFVVFREGRFVAALWMNQESLSDFHQRVEDLLARLTAGLKHTTAASGNS